MFHRRIKAGIVDEPAYQITSRVVAGCPIARAAAATSVQAIAVVDRIAARAKTLARIGGDPKTDLDFLDKFAGVHSQP